MAANKIEDRHSSGDGEEDGAGYWVGDGAGDVTEVKGKAKYWAGTRDRAWVGQGIGLKYGCARKRGWEYRMNW